MSVAGNSFKGQQIKIKNQDLGRQIKMTTELAISPDQKNWTPIQKAGLKQLGLADATEGDLALFFHYAQKTGLDPFSRQIYMIGRWDGRSQSTKYTIQSSIDGLRIVAQRSGEYAGQTAPEWCGEDGQWVDVWLKKEPPTAAKIGVYRVGFAEPLVAVARLSSYMPMTKDGKPMGLWSGMPDVMLAKVAESLALRKAFPNDLSGIYTTEEMDQADHKVVEVKSEPVLSEQDRDKWIHAIAQADIEGLKKIWSEIAEIADVRFTNSLGDEITLKSLIFARKQDLEA